MGGTTLSDGRHFDTILVQKPEGLHTFARPFAYTLTKLSWSVLSRFFLLIMQCMNCGPVYIGAYRDFGKKPNSSFHLLNGKRLAFLCARYLCFSAPRSSREPVEIFTMFWCILRNKLTHAAQHKLIKLLNLVINI